MRRRSRNILWIVLAAVLVAPASWAVHRWWTYPKVPDLAKADVKTSLAYLGSEDFTRLFASHRQQYVDALDRKLRDQSFETLIAMIRGGDPTDGNIEKNLRKLPEGESIRGQFLRIMLDKFYELPQIKRDMYLTAGLLMQQTQRKQKMRPDGAPPPTPEAFMRDAGEFLRRQPPRTQAQTAQILSDLRRQRERLGMKEPW